MIVFKLHADHKKIPLPKRVFNNALKRAHRDMGRFWHRKLRPKHFTRAGATEYGYAPREGERGRPGDYGFRSSYTGKKLRTRGHTRPLEFTGDSRRRTAVRDVRATFKRTRVVMNAPALNFGGGGSRINMRDELKAISDRDLDQMVDAMQRALDGHLARLN